MTASDDLWTGLEALREARPAYVEAAAYYDDLVPEVFSSARIRRAISRTGVDFKLGFIATVVDAVADRLQLASVSSPDATQAALLDTIWLNNIMDLEAGEISRTASRFGDAYMIVLPVHEGDSDTVSGVDMFCNDPLTVRLIYDAENPRLKAFAIKRWCEQIGNAQKPQIIHRAELYYSDRIERWTTKADSPGNSPRDWDPWLPAPIETADGMVVDPEDTAWSISHDYGEIPVFHYRNDRPYGRPEHERGYGAQNAITKLVATHLATVDYQGFPQRFGLTDAATTDTGDLDPADFEDDMFPPDPTAGPSDSGDDSSLKSGPGEMMLLRGFKQVGQFDAAQPDVFYDPAMFHVRAMAQLTVTPLHLFDTSGDQPSGQSIRAQDAPFTRKVDARQSAYGATHRDAFGFALHLLGVEDPQVDVQWKPAETIDDQDVWQTARLKSERGVPNRQLLLEGNYSEDQVSDWLESPTDDAAELSRRLADLATLADTVQKLGAAVTLGAIDQAQVQDLIGPVVDAMTGRPTVAPDPDPAGD
ncbi:phage portal protein [Kitasatospora sp. NPDC047058]|uniref:phage portal protein n=1 Tax=Kitasatospora sp. NPDC047058 TaxID=3155620 RepID=UPI0033CF7349